MTSRFFAGSSSTTSGSGSGSGSSSSGSAEPVAVAGRTRRFNFFDSSSEDDKKRVVRSAKDKRTLELEEVVKKLQNGIKINDWKQIAEQFQALQQKLDKNMNFWKKEGGIPKMYWRTVVQLDKHVSTTLEDKSTVKKMNSSNAKSLNKMKQLIRKLTKTHAKEIEAFLANPQSSASESSSSGSSSSEEEKPAEATKVEEKKQADEKKSKFYGSDSSSGDDGSKNDGSWSSDSGSVRKPSAADKKEANKKSFWYGKDSSSDDGEAKKKERRERRLKQAGRKKKEKGADGANEQKKEIVPEDCDKILQEIIESRGKRGTDAVSQMKKLETLLSLDIPTVKRAEVILMHISIQFDVNPNLFAFLPVAVWRNCVENFNKLVALLQENAYIIIDPAVEDIYKLPETGVPEGTTVRLAGNLCALVERLEDEYMKSLRNIESHKEEYLDRLKDEAVLLDLCVSVQELLGDKWGMPKEAAHVAMRRVEHIYYKRPDVAVAASKEAADKADKEEEEGEKQETDQEAAKRIDAEAEKTLVASDDETAVMHALCVHIYKHGDDRLRARAMLCHIYHHALYDRFFEARDYLLMSHLQDAIQNSRDVPTQILYNRTMVQLGLCAFRNGLIVEAHNCLSDLCSSNRAKELLAQGITNARFGGDRNLEQEKVEKRRLVPYHMHINLEMLECVHLTCAMLLEVPHMAANERETKRRIISKHFRRYFYDRQSAFIGPPENTRDHVIASARHLARGEVQECLDLLLNLPCWKMVASAHGDVKEMVARKVKEEGLRTYLFTYSMYYDAISQAELAEMFDLPPASVHSIVSKMIITEELHASWDQPSACVVVHRTEPTRLQFLALQFAEKATAMVENNERLLDVRSGGAYGGKFDKKGWQGGDTRSTTSSYYNRSYQSGYNKGWGNNRNQGRNWNRNWDNSRGRRF